MWLKPWEPQGKEATSEKYRAEGGWADRMGLLKCGKNFVYF